MIKNTNIGSFNKKLSPSIGSHYLPEEFMDTSNKQRFETMQSRYSKAAYLNNQLDSATSSRIANEGESFSHDYTSFQASVLKKVETIEEQTNQLLQKKQRQLYFLRIQLRNSEQRLGEVEETLKERDREICKLKHEFELLSKKSLKGGGDINEGSLLDLRQQNEKLKQSLRILIQEKNEISKLQNKREHNSLYSHSNVNNLKNEVQQLRAMVTDMENMVYNCPSCFTLRREIQQLTQAYNCLVKEHSELKKIKKEKETDLLQNITQQIQQNQNIIRENIHLREEKQGKPYYFKRRGQKLTESVAKRCRTLTDQF